MKKNLFMALLVLSVFAYSCAPQNGTSAPYPQEEAENDFKPSIIDYGIDGDVKAILEKGSNAKSLSYSYMGPETGIKQFKFYVKDKYVAYKPGTGRSYDLESFYDTIFINKSAKTAYTYCASQECYYPGKKKVLDFDESYIDTPYDWVDGLTSASKEGEMRLQNRDVWKVATNKGTLYIDTYYGIPLKVESNGAEHEFFVMEFNSVSDEEVIPSG